MPKPPRPELIERYRDVLELRPFNWFYEGDKLLDVAEVLRREYLANRRTRFTLELGRPRNPSEQQEETAGACNQASFMMAGYALENFLKGLIALESWCDFRAGRPRTFEVCKHMPRGGYRLGKDLKSHDLSKMAEKVGFYRRHPDQEEEDRRLLSHLTAYVEWAGRYSIALAYLPSDDDEPDDYTLREGLVRRTDDRDWPRILKLAERLREAYREKATYYTEFPDGKLPPEHKR